MQVRHKNTYMMKRVELEVDTGRNETERNW